MKTPFFTQLFMRDRATTQKALDEIQAVVSRSFTTHPCATQTPELRRRVKVCVAHVQEVLNDLGWSMPRALATVGDRLRCDLDKVDWVPSTEASYTSGGESVAQVSPGGIIL